MSPARAFVEATVAWIVGLAIAATGGLFLGVFAPGPAGTVLGAVTMGALYGAVQRRVLGAPRRFVLVTAIVAPFGWLAGAFVAWRLFAADAGALSPWVVGPVLGLVVSVAQSFVLPRARRRSWIVASTIAFTLVVGPMLAAVPALARVVAILVPGLFLAVASIPAASIVRQKASNGAGVSARRRSSERADHPETIHP